MSFHYFFFYKGDEILSKQKTELMNALAKKLRLSLKHESDKQDFLDTLSFAKEHNIGVLVNISIPDLPDLETIIVTNRNIPKKSEYYNSAYNDNMCLISNPRIQIVSAGIL